MLFSSCREGAYRRDNCTTASNPSYPHSFLSTDGIRWAREEGVRLAALVAIRYGRVKNRICADAKQSPIA